MFKISIKKSKVVSCYHIRPSNSESDFWDKFESIISYRKDFQYDFNINILIFDNNLINYVDEPICRTCSPVKIEISL